MQWSPMARDMAFVVALFFNVLGASAFTAFTKSDASQCETILTNTQCLTHATQMGETSTLYYNDPAYPPGCSKRSSPLAGRSYQWNDDTSSSMTCADSGVEHCVCSGIVYVEISSHATCTDAGFEAVADAAECATASTELGRVWVAAFSPMSTSYYYPSEPCWIYNYNGANDRKVYYASGTTTCDTASRASGCICKILLSPPPSPPSPPPVFGGNVQVSSISCPSACYPHIFHDALLGGGRREMYVHAGSSGIATGSLFRYYAPTDSEESSFSELGRVQFSGMGYPVPGGQTVMNWRISVPLAAGGTGDMDKSIFAAKYATVESAGGTKWRIYGATSSATEGLYFYYIEDGTCLGLAGTYSDYDTGGSLYDAAWVNTRVDTCDFTSPAQQFRVVCECPSPPPSSPPSPPPPGFLVVNSPPPPLAPTPPLTSVSTNDNWKYGQVGQSCEEVCNGAGLHCSETAAHNNMEDLDAFGEITSLMATLDPTNSLSLTCSQQSAALSGSEAIAPYFRLFPGNDACYWAELDGSANWRYTCASSFASFNRLCYCIEQRTDDSFVAGEQGQNCNDVCDGSGKRSCVNYAPVSSAPWKSLIDTGPEVTAVYGSLFTDPPCAGYRLTTSGFIYPNQNMVAPFQFRCDWGSGWSTTTPFTCTSNSVNQKRLCFCEGPPPPPPSFHCDEVDVIYNTRTPLDCSKHTGTNPVSGSAESCLCNEIEFHLAEYGYTETEITEDICNNFYKQMGTGLPTDRARVRPCYWNPALNPTSEKCRTTLASIADTDYTCSPSPPPPSPPPSPPAGSPPPWHGLSFIEQGGMNHQQAKDNCASLGGRLAVINTRARQQEIEDYHADRVANGLPNRAFWVCIVCIEPCI